MIVKITAMWFYTLRKSDIGPDRFYILSDHQDIHILYNHSNFLFMVIYIPLGQSFTKKDKCENKNSLNRNF